MPPRTCTPRPRRRSARSCCHCRSRACSRARLLTFIPAAGDFVNSLYLGSPNTTMIGNSIQDQFLVQNNVPLASAMSFVLMFIITVFVHRLQPLLRHGGPRVSACTVTSTGGPDRAVRAERLCRALALLYLFIPIIWIVVFSFNQPTGKYNVTWQQFTLDNWKDPFGDQSLTDAFVVSLKIAAISTVIATILGSLIAIALARYKFRGSGGLNFLLVLPLTTPEIVLGLVARHPLPRLGHHAGIHHRRDRPHHVPGQFRRAHGARPRARVRLDARTGRPGPRGVAVPNVLEGHVPADPAGHPRRGAAVVRARRSTTSSSRCSTPARS